MSSSFFNGSGGGGSNPITIPQSDTYPSIIGVPNIKVLGRIGSAGLAMGPLGLSYSREEIAEYYFAWKGNNGDLKGVELV